MKTSESFFISGLTLLFIHYKMTGVVDWPWWWVMSPLWILILIMLMVIFGYVQFLIKKEQISWRQLWKEIWSQKMFSSVHYKEIANILKSTEMRFDTRDVLESKFVRLFRKDNPCFSEEKFLSSCNPREE